MDEKTLRVFKFTREAVASQLRWEHAEEFEYQGQLYDVVERQQVGDTTVFKCWWDRKETQVKAQLEDLIAKTLKQHPPNQESQKRLQQFLTFLFFEAPTFQWYAQPCPVGTEAPGWCQRRYVPFNTSPPTPPPKIG